MNRLRGRDSNAQPPLDPRVPAALVVAAIVGILAEQFGAPTFYLRHFPTDFATVTGRLSPRLWQVTVHLALYVLVPSLVARRCGARLSLWTKPTAEVLAQVALLWAIAVPIALALSFLPGFTDRYPLFQSAALRPVLLLLWLPLFGAFLFSVEFFYRGFLLSMLSPALGRAALFVMIVPYALTHADWIEALGAVAVGLVLGTLALRSRSIWPGLVLHAGVAFTVELIGLWQLRRHLH